MSHLFYGLPLLTVILIWVFGTLTYFLPTIVAVAHKKKQILSIILLNIFAGWTLIGWLVALVWAAIKQKKSFMPSKLFYMK